MEIVDCPPAQDKSKWFRNSKTVNMGVRRKSPHLSAFFLVWSLRVKSGWLLENFHSLVNFSGDYFQGLDNFHHA